MERDQPNRAGSITFSGLTPADVFRQAADWMDVVDQHDVWVTINAVHLDPVHPGDGVGPDEKWFFTLYGNPNSAFDTPKADQ